MGPRQVGGRREAVQHLGGLLVLTQLEVSPAKAVTGLKFGLPVGAGGLKYPGSAGGTLASPPGDPKSQLPGVWASMARGPWG